MTRSIPMLLVMIVALFASTPLFAETANIDIKDFFFQQTPLTINVGDKVKWTNRGSATHTSTSNTGLWNSPNLQSGATFTRTFNKPGQFAYHCAIHPSMTGVIKVRTLEQSRIQIGKDIITSAAKRLPIKLNLAGKNPAQVYLGSYIVNAQGGCNDCHTCPSFAAGHDPYKGQPLQFNAANYLAGGKAFGPFISANITPDATGKPAGVTLAEFKHLLRTGEDHEAPGNIIQVMPWPIYGLMSDHDLEAVYAYLSSIPRKAKSPSPSACP